MARTSLKWPSQFSKTSGSKKLYENVPGTEDRISIDDLRLVIPIVKKKLKK